MGEMIQKPDANPIVIAAGNFFLFGAVGYFLMGQEKKAMIAAAVTIIGSMCSFGLLGAIAALTFTYDGYLLAQKLQSGQSIGKNENAIEFLNNIFKD